MPALSHLIPKERAAIEAYIDNIRECFTNRILTVMLFGSKARGDADVESDIDLLIIVDTENDEFRSKLWQVASDISLDYNVVISPRVFGQTQWDEMSRMRLPLYRAIIADGIILDSESVSP